MLNQLLLEIGTEEIPASYIPAALKQIEVLAQSLLSEARLGFGSITTYGTPRRLVLRVNEVEERQQEMVKEIIGPPQKAAFSRDGQPTQAAYGFAKSQGVEVEELRIKETEKGAYICIEKSLPVLSSQEILESILPRLILSISWPKSMHWGNSEISFARPIRWVLALLGKEVIEFELDGLKSGQITYGHRFLAPGPIKIDSPEDYLEAIRQAFVIVDPEERRAIIRAGIEDYLLEGRLDAPGYQGWLEEEVVYLVEYPGVIKGSFNKSYLNVPAEVLMAAMQSHQRYFPLIERESGRLRADFLVIANSNPDCQDEVRRGNERVLAARLADAAFFFHEDKKKPLPQWVEDEKQRVFQEELGSLYEKTERLTLLAERIAEEVDISLAQKAARAAWLCKADLSTQVVGEFPELQGIIGQHYARLSGQDESVAVAIREHYLPISSKGELPETLLGAIVSLTDKMDTISGCFGVGIIPTGSQDPYALRRQAQGIVDTILKHQLALSLSKMIDWSLGLLSQKIKRGKEEINKELRDFFSQRIKTALIDKGISQDEAEATLSVGWEQPIDALARGMALSGIRQEPDFEALVVGFKRAVNIVRKEGGEEKELKRELLIEQAEQELYQAYEDVRIELNDWLLNQAYTQALKALIRLKQPIDRFFDDVMVMVEEKAMQRNRLALLAGIASLFLAIADLSCLKERGLTCLTCQTKI